MKNQKQRLIELYKEKISLFEKYNEAYFKKDRPLIDDAKFDKLKNEILELEKKKQVFKKC